VLLPYVERDRFVTLAGSKSGLRVTLSYLKYRCIRSHILKYKMMLSNFPFFLGLPNNSYKSITNMALVWAWLCKLQKGCTRLATASNKVYQFLAHGRWFSSEFFKFIGPIGPRGQKITRSANHVGNAGPHVRQTFLNDVFTFLTEVGNAGRIVNTGTSSVNSDWIRDILSVFGKYYW
jgi:hypothetical protein